jgi:hypothetical protein
MKWLRLYNDTPNDRKWRVISVRSGQPVGTVLAVWMMMLTCASEAEQRGTLEDWDDETVAAVLGYAPEIVTVIRASMQGLVLDGWRLTGWDKRQFTSDASAERTRRYRAKNTQNDGGDGGSTQKPNGADTGHGDGDVTSQRDSVTSQRPSHTGNVTSLPLRATDSQKESNSVASATAPPEVGAAPDASLKSKLFNECLVWLIATTRRNEKSLRPMIGRWIGKHGEGAVLAAIVRAQQEAAVSPVGFVEGVLRSGSKRHDQANGSKHERLAHGFAGAFGDLLVPRSADTGGECDQIAVGYR